MRIRRNIEGQIPHPELLGQSMRRVFFANMMQHPQALAHAKIRGFRKEAMLQLDGRKQIGMREQHLRLAEQQVPRLVQRKMKPRQDVILHLGIKIHQRIATDQQIEPGDRRVGGQVMPSEDNHAPHIGMDDIAILRPLEILLEQRRRHRLDLLGRVDGLARVVKGA